MSDAPKLSEKDEETIRWVMRLLRTHKIDCMRWPDGAWGTVNAPRKWGNAIGDLVTALCNVRAGGDLPKFTADLPKEAKKKRAKQEEREPLKDITGCDV